MGNLKVYLRVLVHVHFKGHLAYCTRKMFYEETNKKTNRIIVSYQVKGIEVYECGPKFTLATHSQLSRVT